MTADLGTPWDTDAAAASAPGGALQTYLDPATGRHYTQRPDGTSRWLTGAEEATLAWRATAVPTGDVFAEVDDRPRARTARPAPARHAGPFEDLIGSLEAGGDEPAPRSRPTRAADGPRPRRAVGAVGAAALTGVVGLLAGAAVGVVADLPGEPATAVRAVAAAPAPTVTVTVPGPATTTTVEATVTRTVTAGPRRKTASDADASQAAASPSASPSAAGDARTDPRFDTCRLAKAAGYGPYLRGTDPEYGWYTDRDDDGVVCD